MAEEYEGFDLGPPIKGACMTMCPISEIIFREKEELVHRLERGSAVNTERMVKWYQRPAAGVVPQFTSIRPAPVLLTTVHYLLNKVICSDELNFGSVYNFIQDRLRAVRQDLIIQQCSPAQCIPILEPMVRFYSYSYYRMSGESSGEYDPVLNHNHLLECIKWLLRLYDSCGHQSQERCEMESFYILLNLGDPQALSRSLTLPKSVRMNLVLEAEEISLAWYLNNYWKACKKILELPILHQALTCAAHLSQIRRFALQVMSTAFSSKNLLYPLLNLKVTLLYDDEKDVTSDCKYYGIDVTESSVHFTKGRFNTEEKSVHFKGSKNIEEKLKSTSLPEIVLSSVIV